MILKTPKYRNIFALICLTFISLTPSNSKAFVISEQTAIEQEAEARHLKTIWNSDEIRHSVTLFSEVSRKWIQLRNFNKATNCLREVAKLSMILSEHNNSLSALQTAIKIDSKTNNIEGLVLNNALIAQLKLQQSRIDQSLTYITKAIKLSELSTDYAKAYTTLVAGEIELIRADIKAAKQLFIKALKISNTIDDADLKANILLNYGLSQSILDEYDAGLKSVEEAKQIWNELEDKRGIALSYNAIGFIYTIFNEPQIALNNFYYAEAMFPIDLDYTEKAKMYSGIAKIHIDFGRTKLAEHNLLQALENYKNAKFEFGQMALLPNIAILTYFNGNKDRSEVLFKEASILSNKFSNDHYTANLKEENGNLNLIEGKYDDAIKLFQQAQAIYDKSEIKLTRALNSLGVAYEKKGDLITAENYFQKALKYNLDGKNDFQASENLYNLSRLYKEKGNYPDALKYIEKSIKFTESLYNNVGNHLLRKSFFSNTYDRYELYISLLIEMHKLFPNEKFEQKALQASEQARSRLMKENLKFAEVDLSIDADPLLVKKENKISQHLTTKKEELTSVLIQKHGQIEVDKLNLEIEKLDYELQNVKATLRASSPFYSALKNSSTLDIKGFQNTILDKNTVLLEFFFGKEKSYLWLVEKNDIKIIELPNSQYLDSKIDNLLNLIINKNNTEQLNIAEFQKILSENQSKYWLEAQELSRTLFGRIIDKIENKRLIVIPDGKLQYFPLSALPKPFDRSNKPLFLSNEIILEPSASMLYLLRTKRNNLKSPQNDFLIYTDPVFSNQDVRISSAHQSNSKRFEININDQSLSDEESLNSLNLFTRLESSEEESNNIFKYFDLRHSKIIKGFDASRTNFLSSDLQRYKVLHFATHGLFNDKSPQLSGIVLSQYDNKGNQQNGFVWLQDIYSLKLDADLVVLSACDTAIGDDEKGEGLMSLTNGFLQVGSKSVISSHWKIDDQATLVFMDYFYEALADNEVTPSEALQEAKLKMYQNPIYRSPYYWASFTIHGDFINKPQLKTKFNYSTYFSILLSILFVFGIVRFIDQNPLKLFNSK